MTESEIKLALLLDIIESDCKRLSWRIMMVNILVMALTVSVAFQWYEIGKLQGQNNRIEIKVIPMDVDDGEPDV